MARVKIKHPRPNNAARLKLLEILSVNLVYAIRITTSNDGYIILIRKEENLNKIFSEDITKSVENNNFTPILPPELKAKRTILIIVDKLIHDSTETDMQE